MNILLSSVGRRSYLIKYFKYALGSNGQVHVSNSTNITPAFTYADRTVVTPLIHSKEYIPFLLDYCKTNNISAVISLFDIDLPVLSKNKSRFEEIGTKVIVSDENVIEICNDKLLTYKFLKENGFKTPKTFISIHDVLKSIKKEEINFPLIIKPRWGMGSIGCFEADNENELYVLYNKVITSIKNSYLIYESEKNLDESVIIQEKLKGSEYGLDIINDLNGNYQNTIIKRKLAMRAGETDCAEVVDNNKLKNLGQAISSCLKHIGNLDVDIFMIDEEPYILEMNARFGGGYPFSHIAGVNLPLAIIKWLKNEDIDSNILKEQYGILAHKDIEIVSLFDGQKNQKKEKCSNYKLVQVNTSSEINYILEKFDKVFSPSINARIPDLDKYSNKLLNNAFVFAAKDYTNKVIGFIAFYANDMDSKVAYITFIGVHPNYQNKKIGKQLLKKCLDVSISSGMEFIKLEVQKINNKAINFYKKYGFQYLTEASKDSIYMIKKLKDDCK